MTTSPFLPPVHHLERDARLDGPVQTVESVAHRVGDGPAGSVLRGEWLGHALHPLLTDFPLGCWLSAGLLDVVGGRGSRRAAQKLIGIGVAMVPITAAAGAADYASVDDRGAKRVGAAHALGNTVVGMLYLLSWRHRRQGRHGLGVATAMLGAAGAWVTGYLGGHLSFGKAQGTSERGTSGDELAGMSPVARGAADDETSGVFTPMDAAGTMEGAEAPFRS